MAASTQQTEKAQDGAQVKMINVTTSLIKLDRSQNWSGSVVGSFPTKIVVRGSSTFTHLSDGMSGSKAAVVYTGLASDGLPIAWVLAWDVPTDTTVSPIKVFGTRGPKSVIDGMSFDEILAALENSDNGSGDASIESTPNLASIVVNFGAN